MNICKWNSAGKKMFASGQVSDFGCLLSLLFYQTHEKSYCDRTTVFQTIYFVYFFSLFTKYSGIHFFSATSQRSSRRQRETRHSGEQHLVPFVMIRSEALVKWSDIVIIRVLLPTQRFHWMISLPRVCRVQQR